MSPLPAKDLALAYWKYVSYPSSLEMKRNMSPLLDGCCAKLKSWGPSVSHLQALGAPTTTNLLHRSELKALAQHTSLLPDPSLPRTMQDPRAGPPQQRHPGACRGSALCRPTVPPLQCVSAAGVTQRRRSGRHPPILAFDEQLCALERAILCTSGDGLAHTTLTPPPPNPTKWFLDATALPNAIPPDITMSSSVCRRLPNKPPDAARPRPRTSRQATRFGVPHAMVMLKHKFQECTPRAKIKVREVIRHGSNPFKRVAKLMSRCPSVLWKFVIAHHSSIEIMVMLELRGFVKTLRESQPRHSGSLWGELDAEEMFPNIPKHLIPTAVQFYWNMIFRAQEKRPSDLVFHIHKSSDKSLDHAAGPPRSQSYHRVPLNDLVAFIHWDLLLNDNFIDFSPMGGSCSTQYASIVLNYLERSVDGTLLPPIVRYRDNYLVYASPFGSPSPQSFVRSSPSIDSAQQFLTQVKRTISSDSSLKLTVEGWGQSRLFLDSEVLIFEGLPNIEVNHPCLTLPRVTHSLQHADGCLIASHRTPNACSCRSCLTWLKNAPGTALTCVRKVSSLLIRKGYPSYWWRPLLLAKAESTGLQQHARSGIQLALALLHDSGTRETNSDGQLLSSTPSSLQVQGIRAAK